MSPIFLSVFAFFLYFNYVSGVSTDDYFNIKVEVDPDEISCYYHNFKPKRSVILEINSLEYDENLQIADIGITISVNGTVRIEKSSVKSYTWEEESLQGGEVKVCLNNKRDGRNSKIVSLYFSYYMDTVDDDMRDEVNTLDVRTETFILMFQALERIIRNCMYWSRVTSTFLALDSSHLEYTGNFISYWSAVHCMVILLSAAVQVYFIRKLFDSEHTGRSKFWNLITGE